ncbi:hypothetical protein POVWA2_010770 [Plasmodium ovale wallikeri]|uniref:Uncharacterized protein n=1 Tax=Plasmodium ovale wallikeri TaxID=864142 RepID=A0A1A8YMR3_PLAOA|nr:hypothetical protein POVWA2_010770 [Plasmodium ovale wallikeri]
MRVRVYPLANLVNGEGPSFPRIAGRSREGVTWAKPHAGIAMKKKAQGQKGNMQILKRKKKKKKMFTDKSATSVVLF